MLVPATLKVPWTKVGNVCRFSCYYIKFYPNPADRTYRKFGLFVKEPLPDEAGNLSLDLCLARGRMVKTKLIPSGGFKFDKVEVRLSFFIVQYTLAMHLVLQNLIFELTDGISREVPEGVSQGSS